MTDYTEAPTLFTPNGILHGLQPIRELFVMLLKEFAEPGMSFELLRQDVDGDTAYIRLESRDSGQSLRDRDGYVLRKGWEDRDPNGRWGDLAEALRPH